MRQFSRTFVSSFSPVQPTNTEDTPTSFLRDFLANLSQQEESAGEKKTIGTCGQKQLRWREEYDQNGFFSKMFQDYSHLATLEKSSKTFPSAGMMRTGELFQQTTWERPISEKGSGLLPTLLADDYRSTVHKTREGNTLPEALNGGLNPDWSELFMGFPIGWTSLNPLKKLDRYGHWEEDWHQNLPPTIDVSVDRGKRLRALGNAWVPTVAVKAWHLLVEHEEET